MMIPYGRQSIDQADVDAVVEVLKSDFLTQGPAVPRFEKTVSDYCGAGHAVAVNSATSAIHIACLALGLGPGDILWTSPITFVASANCALYCGAEVDFVDIDPRTGNMSVEALARKLITAERSGRLPKVVVPVHFAGQSCDMVAIAKLAQKYGFKVIEDASHAIGGKYLGQPVGSCRYSDIAVFSFHPVKIITTGEGGMALTNDSSLAEKMILLRSHGITRDADRMVQEPDGPWYYQQIALGFNFRLSDLQAALGDSQFQRLFLFHSRRQELAARYDDLLALLPLIRPQQHADTHSAWHLYVIRLSAATRLAVYKRLKARGIHAQVHYIPVHTQPWYRNFGFKAGDFPAAEDFYASVLSLPIYYGLSNADQDHVVNALKSALEA